MKLSMWDLGGFTNDCWDPRSYLVTPCLRSIWEEIGQLSQQQHCRDMYRIKIYADRYMSSNTKQQDPHDFRELGPWKLYPA